MADVLIEGLTDAGTTGVEGGKVRSLPPNYSKVAGNSWMDSPDGKEFLRFDWIDGVYEYHLAQDNRRWWNDYFANTGLTEDDIRYKYRSGYYRETAVIPAYSEMINFVSSNVTRLYR